MLLLLSAALGQANDASFYGDGATVFAVKEARVRMAAETIVIVRTGLAKPDERWSADCRFTFFNESHETANVQMGFPDWRTWGDGADAPWSIRSFTAAVDGKPVDATRKGVAVPRDGQGVPLARGGQNL